MYAISHYGHLNRNLLELNTFPYGPFRSTPFKRLHFVTGFAVRNAALTADGPATICSAPVVHPGCCYPAQSQRPTAVHTPRSGVSDAPVRVRAGKEQCRAERTIQVIHIAGTRTHC